VPLEWLASDVLEWLKEKGFVSMFISGDSKLKQTVLLPAYAVTLLKQYVGFINDGALGRLIKWDWGAGKFVNQGF